jgi:hypothetical protein
MLKMEIKLEHLVNDKNGSHKPIDLIYMQIP